MDENRNGDNNNKSPQNRRVLLACLVVTGIMVLFFSYFTKSMSKDSVQEIKYNEFLSMLANDKIGEVLIKSDRIVIKPKTASSAYGREVIYYTGIMDDPELVNRLSEKGVAFSEEVVDSSTTIIDIFLAYILPFIIIYGLMFFLFRGLSKGGGIMGVGKSNAKIYNIEKETGITFKDVAGEDEAKESISELVDFLHNPGKYQKIGAKLPKGALLVGPPGTGKTLLAKAVAGEAHVPFFSITGSDFVEMFVGVGASRVRDLFKQAQAQAPCIVFIDEIDAIGKSRDAQYGGGNDEREQTLNQLLSEMDGFDTSKGVVIIAATNRPEVLDKALLRPGRFDRRIIVDKPDLKGRVEILKVHAKNVLLDDSVNLEEIGLATSGAVGSDLANIINEAAIMAVKKNRTLVTQDDLMESVEVVIAGKEKKDRILSEKEKKIVAYHETGHALITALEKNAEPVQKITIVPRTMGSLGYVMQVPEEEK
ncbi:MAG: ATP-dependent zinc metalloprotease FtsH, partial [Lachnospiraceae bacterium]|nr:ATP-dependent zinc metalloprotease FtsH [Lachnospiraceae bacterium]